jgi:hypothetical protein
MVAGGGATGALDADAGAQAASNSALQPLRPKAATSASAAIPRLRAGAVTDLRFSGLMAPTGLTGRWRA